MSRSLAVDAAHSLPVLSSFVGRRRIDAVEHTETVNHAGLSSHLKITCRSGHLHASWSCDCGAGGIASPFVTVESAIEAAYAAVDRHHHHRHSTPILKSAIV